MMSSLNLHNRAIAGELVPGKTPYEDRGNRKLLLHVPRAADSGQSAPFPTTGNIDRASDSRQSGQSSSHSNIIPSPTNGVKGSRAANGASRPTTPEGITENASTRAGDTRRNIIRQTDGVKRSKRCNMGIRALDRQNTK